MKIAKMSSAPMVFEMSKKIKNEVVNALAFQTTAVRVYVIALQLLNFVERQGICSGVWVKRKRKRMPKRSLKHNVLDL